MGKSFALMLLLENAKSVDIVDYTYLKYSDFLIHHYVNQSELYKSYVLNN